jgi:hypothetical protein
VMEHVHLNCRELVIHPFVLALASSAEHPHRDYRELKVELARSKSPWLSRESGGHIYLDSREHIRLDCRAGMEHIRMLSLRACRLGLFKAWDQGQNRLVELHDLKT